ncbi:hypothetical protein EDD17DRAFT_478128 [Pisolithus thermaeus]|nr:hypothetical protein EDD17DRAFT_478128 [Pisolithus thermaeus]
MLRRLDCMPHCSLYIFVLTLWFMTPLLLTIPFPSRDCTVKVCDSFPTFLTAHTFLHAMNAAFISILLGVSSLQRLVEIAQSSEKEWSEEQWFKITERLFNRNANIIIVSALMVTCVTSQVALRLCQMESVLRILLLCGL